MAIELNHLIIFARDKHESATFITDILGLPPPQPDGRFMAVELANRVRLDYAEPGIEFPGQHYAFIVSEAEFDASLARIKQRGLPFQADPRGERPGEINTNDGGKGVYFFDPSGHGMELITVPYGGWPARD